MIFLSFYSKKNSFFLLMTFTQELTTNDYFFCNWRKVRRIRQSNKNSFLLIIFYVCLNCWWSLKIIYGLNLTIILYNKHFFLLESFIKHESVKKLFIIYKTSILFSFRINLIYEFVKKNCHNHYNFFQIIIITHNLLLTFGYICPTFYTFGD